MAIFGCLYFNKQTKLAAQCFIVGWAFYVVATIGLPATKYYVTAAFIEFSIGYILNKDYRLVSYISYSLILVNAFGLLLYKNAISPLSYDIIYFLLSVTQVVLLIIRGLYSGSNRHASQRLIICLLHLDSRKESHNVRQASENKEVEG